MVKSEKDRTKEVMEAVGMIGKQVFQPAAKRRGVAMYVKVCVDFIYVCLETKSGMQIYVNIDEIELVPEPMVKTYFYCPTCGMKAFVEHSGNAGVYEVANKMGDIHRRNSVCWGLVHEMRIVKVEE